MRPSVATAVALLLAQIAFGCGRGDETDAPTSPPATGCAPGEWAREGGVCRGPDTPCLPGEWLGEDGTCVPAGVPPDGCGEGFVHDGDRGCEAILPTSPCPPGLMAVPGETTCREVAPCPPGRWGDTPVEPDTVYVDASYSGMDSDGTALKPWTTVQAAVDAASFGAIVAIAQGSYLEDVTVSGKPVRFWGVCPSLVEVVGTGAEWAALDVLEGASGTEVRALSIRGSATGFSVSGAIDVLLERVLLHDADYGVSIDNAFGPSIVALRDSLIEHNLDTGVFVGAAQLTIERSVARDTQPGALGPGRGVEIMADPTAGTPASLFMRGSVVEMNHDVGVYVEGSEATVETSVVRETLTNDMGAHGRGVTLQPNSGTGAPSTLVLRASVVEHNRQVGVIVLDSDVTVEASVIRDTRPSDAGLFPLGRGLDVEASTLVLRSSLVEQSHDCGVAIIGSDATVEASVVRDTQSDAEGFFGHGIHVQADSLTGAPSTFAMHASLVEKSHEVGVAIAGSEATLDACVVDDTVPSTAWGGGDGLMVASELGPASATVTQARIHQSAVAAVAAWGAHVALGGSALSCQVFDLDQETYEANAATLEDLGGNVCGCPEPASSCKAVSASLQPPAPLAPAPEE